MILSLLPASVFAVKEVSGDFMQSVDQITWEDIIPNGYTTISTEAELEAIESNPAGRYILMEDIEIESFEILCSNDNPFTGVLEGNGHTISGDHHYTGSTEEHDNLVNVGWIYEGIGWFGLLN